MISCVTALMSAINRYFTCPQDLFTTNKRPQGIKLNIVQSSSFLKEKKE